MVGPVRPVILLPVYDRTPLAPQDLWSAWSSDPVMLATLAALALQECLASTYVSSVGQYVDRFETEIQAFTGARHAVAVPTIGASLAMAASSVARR